MSWPLPRGWRSETISFPPDFAPDLGFDGLEKIQFAPAFFTPESPDHWTYALAWLVVQENDLRSLALEGALRTYFLGLCSAIAADEHRIDPERYRVAISSPRRTAVAGHPAERFDGTAGLEDAFGDWRPITLDLVITAWRCPDSDISIIVIEASPHAPRVRQARRLAARRRAFRCHAPEA